MSGRLTINQDKAAQEYVKHGNKSAAYRSVYSTKNMSANAVHVEASKLFDNPKVSLRVEELREKVAQASIMSAQEALLEVSRLARFDIRKLYDEDGSPIPIHLLDKETAAAIQSVDIEEIWSGKGKSRVFVGYTKKYKVVDKNVSLEKLLKYHGQYEKDNKQRGDAVAEFLNGCSGAGLSAVKG